jgi:ElaB/YqjD/DUF883 family membrane-anchored ribosome-binding protein
MRIWRAEPTDAGERLQRLAEPIQDVKNRLTGAMGEAQKRFIGARASASGKVADHPLRWIMIALAAGAILGAALVHRRGTRESQYWR